MGQCQKYVLQPACWLLLLVLLLCFSCCSPDVWLSWLNSTVAFFPVPAHLATNHHLTDGIIHVQHYAVGILEDCLGACLQWLKMPPHRPLHTDTTTVALIMHNWHVMAVDWEVSTIVNEKNKTFPLYILMNLNHINTWQEMTNKDVSVKYFKIFCLFFFTSAVVWKEFNVAWWVSEAHFRWVVENILN